MDRRRTNPSPKFGQLSFNPQGSKTFIQNSLDRIVRMVCLNLYKAHCQQVLKKIVYFRRDPSFKGCDLQLKFIRWWHQLRVLWRHQMNQGMNLEPQYPVRFSDFQKAVSDTVHHTGQKPISTQLLEKESTEINKKLDLLIRNSEAE